MSSVQSLLKIIQDAAKIQIKRSKSIASSKNQRERVKLPPDPPVDPHLPEYITHRRCHSLPATSCQPCMTREATYKEPLQEFQQSDELEFLNQRGCSRFPSLPKTLWTSYLGTSDGSCTNKRRVSDVLVLRTADEILQRAALPDVFCKNRETNDTFRLLRPSTWRLKLLKKNTKVSSDLIPTNIGYEHFEEQKSASSKCTIHKSKKSIRAYMQSSPIEPFKCDEITLPSAHRRGIGVKQHGQTPLRETSLYKKLQTCVENWTKSVGGVKCTKAEALVRRATRYADNSDAIKRTRVPWPRLQTNAFEGLLPERQHLTMQSRHYGVSRVSPRVSIDDPSTDLPESRLLKKAYVFPTKGLCGCEARQVKPAEMTKNCQQAEKIQESVTCPATFQAPGCEPRTRCNCDPVLPERSLCTKPRAPSPSFAEIIAKPGRKKAAIDSRVMEDLKKLQPAVTIVAKNELQALKTRRDRAKQLSRPTHQHAIQEDVVVETKPSVASLLSSAIARLCRPQPSFGIGYTRDAAFPSGLLIATNPPPPNKIGDGTGMHSRIRFPRSLMSGKNCSQAMNGNNHRFAHCRSFSTDLRPDVTDVPDKVGEAEQLRREGKPIRERILTVRAVLKRYAYCSKVFPRLRRKKTSSTEYFPTLTAATGSSVNDSGPETTGQTGQLEDVSETNAEVGSTSVDASRNIRTASTFIGGYLNYSKDSENTMFDFNDTARQASGNTSPEDDVDQLKVKSPNVQLYPYLTRDLNHHVQKFTKSDDFDRLDKSSRITILKKISNAHKTVKVSKYSSYSKRELDLQNSPEAPPKFIHIEKFSPKLKFVNDAIATSDRERLGSGTRNSNQIDENHRFTVSLNNSLRKSLSNLHKPKTLARYRPTVINKTSKHFHSELNALSFYASSQTDGLAVEISTPLSRQTAIALSPHNKALSPKLKEHGDVSPGSYSMMYKQPNWSKFSSTKESSTNAIGNNEMFDAKLKLSEMTPSITGGINQHSSRRISQLKKTIKQHNNSISNVANSLLSPTGKDSKTFSSPRHKTNLVSTVNINDVVHKQILNMHKTTKLRLTPLESKQKKHRKNPNAHENQGKSYKTNSMVAPTESIHVNKNAVDLNSVDNKTQDTRQETKTRNSNTIGSAKQTVRIFSVPLTNSRGNTLSNTHKTEKTKYVPMFTYEINRNFHAASCAKSGEVTINRKLNRQVTFNKTKRVRQDSGYMPLNFVDDYCNESDSNYLSVPLNLKSSCKNDDTFYHTKTNPRVYEIFRESPPAPSLREDLHKDIATLLGNYVVQYGNTVHAARVATRSCCRSKHEISCTDGTLQQDTQKRFFASNASSVPNCDLAAVTKKYKTTPVKGVKTKVDILKACGCKLSAARPYKECRKPPKMAVKPEVCCDDYKPKIIKCDYKAQKALKEEAVTASVSVSCAQGGPGERTESSRRKGTCGTYQQPVIKHVNKDYSRVSKPHHEHVVNSGHNCDKKQSSNTSSQVTAAPIREKRSKLTCDFQSDMCKELGDSACLRKEMLLCTLANRMFIPPSSAESQHEQRVNTGKSGPPPTLSSASVSLENVASVCENRDKEKSRDTSPGNSCFDRATPSNLKRTGYKCCEDNQAEEKSRDTSSENTPGNSCFYPATASSLERTGYTCFGDNQVEEKSRDTSSGNTPGNSCFYPATASSLERTGYTCCGDNQAEEESINAVQATSASVCQGATIKSYSSIVFETPEVCHDAGVGEVDIKEMIKEANKHRFLGCANHGETNQPCEESATRCANVLKDFGDAPTTTTSSVNTANPPRTTTDSKHTANAPEHDLWAMNVKAGMKQSSPDAASQESDICENASRDDTICTKEMIMEANSHRFAKCHLNDECSVYQQPMDGFSTGGVECREETRLQCSAEPPPLDSTCTHCDSAPIWEGSQQDAWKTCRKMKFSCPPSKDVEILKPCP